MQQIRPQDHEVDVRNEMRAQGLARDSANQDYYEEIDLREYIEIALRRKGIVSGVFFTLVLIAVIWNCITLKTYEVSTVIAPPITMTTDGGLQEIDSASNIKSQIDSGAYNFDIISSLGINDLVFREDLLKFDVSQPKDSKIVKISLNLKENRTDIGKKILARLIEDLNLHYDPIIADRRGRIENQKKIAISGIAKENEIKLRNEQYKILANKEQQYDEEMKRTEANSEKLLANRSALLDRKDNKDDISLLLYTSTIQQNISYFAQLQNEISDAKIQSENILNGIENLKTGINEDRIAMENLNLSEVALHNISVIQSPSNSSRPVGPKRTRNILVTGIAGLIIGLFASFFVEYWQNP